MICKLLVEVVKVFVEAFKFIIHLSQLRPSRLYLLFIWVAMAAG